MSGKIYDLKLDEKAHKSFLVLQERVGGTPTEVGQRAFQLLSDVTLDASRDAEFFIDRKDGNGIVPYERIEIAVAKKKLLA